MIKLFQALLKSIHRPSVRWTPLILFPLATLGINGTASAQEIRAADPKAGDAILIMDYSNSMWGQINGVPKVEIARDIIDANFSSWKRLTNLGLMSYGHRYKNDCADIQLISPPGELDTSIVDRFLAQAQPKGRTPLASSIEQAASYFIANGKEANIILLTDGIESCDRDPCATIGALQDAGLKMTAHVIGFGVTEEEGSQLRCIASITGGEYLTAANATSLDDAFQEAIDHSDLIIGGTSNQFNSDEEGPEINIFIDDINFISGDEVSKSPLLIVEAYDQSGLNLTNMNSYQKMIGIVDDTTIIYLNDYFTYNKDDYQRGIIRYPLGDLGSGRHKIEIKITDNYNNLSSNSVVFIIGENNRLNIKNVMNFPNPFSDYTTFKFDLPQEDQSIFVNLEIYDLRGNKVYNYTHTYEFSPLVVEDIYWNGNDLNNYPLPQGIYIYKLHVNNLVNGKKVTVHNKVFKKL